MRRWLPDLVAAVSLLGSVLASAALVAGLVGFGADAGSWRWYVWVIVSPFLYLGWLVSFLTILAVSCRQIGSRNPKPRHAVVHPGLERPPAELLGMATAAMCYRRLAILQSVPLVSLLSQFRHLDTLVLRAYSPSVHIGRNVVNWGGLYDPDLTEIGDDVVLGGQSTVAAHSMVARDDGALVYVSAAVRIGDRATIGGEARVALGCAIGPDAIVEPGAVLEPFTHVPAGEVWGGNPARFRRRREDIRIPPADLRGSEPLPGAPALVEQAAGAERRSALPPNEQARAVVAAALGLAREQASGELSTETCPLWDSLGQVAIAATLFDHHGITVAGADIFRLRNLDDVAGMLVGRGPGASAAATDERRAIEPEAPGPGAPPLPDDPEMLPLLDPQAATRLLAASLEETRGGGTQLRLNIVASFTAQQIGPALELWGRAFGLDIECEFAGYGQVVQALLDRGGPLAENRDRATVVLMRPEDLSAGTSAATAELDQILDAIEQAAADRSPGHRLLVGTLPPVVSAFSDIDAGQSEAMRLRWRERLAAIPGVELFDFSGVVERMGIDNARDSQMEALTRGGYSQRGHQELAIALVRRLLSAHGRRAKVVALDCDNTLWGGVVGEVGVDGLQLGPDGPGRSFQLFQRYLKRLEERGLLLVVVSRNEEHDVREVFDRHPEMIVGVDDIAAWRVNWLHKSENLRQLAEELNLGLDSFVFLDDDPATRLEVKTRAPAVHVVPLPDDPAGYCEVLDRLWLFDGADVTDVTEVDATRTRKAQEEQRRRRERGSAASLEDYLERLELEVDLRRAGDRDVPRVGQLMQRTNQFNLSLKRRTIEDVKALVTQSTVLTLEARDRFGDYGQIGVCVLEAGGQPGCWEIDTLLMSCRALGRGIEDAFLHGIATAAADNGGTALLAAFRPGPRNGQVKDFLARAGFDEVEPDVWRRSIESRPPLPAHVRYRDLRADGVPAITI